MKLTLFYAYPLQKKTKQICMKVKEKEIEKAKKNKGIKT